LERENNNWIFVIRRHGDCMIAADVVTGAFGKDLLINEFTYNSFLIVTLGSFGIAGIEKFAKKDGSK
jgi:hypothetical protein